VTAAPDHRTGHVTLACACGAELVLPPRAAEAARAPWDRIHSGPGHGPAEPGRRPASTFEQFIAVAGQAGRR
jgi:hypothetical protein